MLVPLTGNDLILCQITSQARLDEYSIAIEDTDFVSGGLRQSSRIRPNRLFTADSAIVTSRIGRVSDPKLKEVLERLIAIIGKY